MCRSIKTLRPPFHSDVTPDDVQAAALAAVADATQVLLRDVQVRGVRRPAGA